MYVDESGDHSYRELELPGKRFLCLTGVVVEDGPYKTTIQPEVEAIKARFFRRHSPDEPVVFHRKDIVERRGHFSVLQDQAIDARFRADVLGFLGGRPFQIFSAVIDKKSHIDRYGGAALHPYHYCFTVILERYSGFLKVNNSQGDVLAESRGGTEDRELKEAYSLLWNRGTGFHSAASFQARFTSSEVKLKRKEMNIAGLQIADLLAHPLKQDILAQYGFAESVNSDFARQICGAVVQKQNRYGRVFLG